MRNKIILLSIFLLYSCSDNSNDIISIDNKKDMSHLDKNINQINQSIILSMKDDKYTRWIVDDIDMNLVNGDESEISKKQYEFLGLVKSGEINNINNNNTSIILVNNSPINNTLPLWHYTTSSNSNKSLNIFGVYRDQYSVGRNGLDEGAGIAFGEYRDILIIN